MGPRPAAGPGGGRGPGAKEAAGPIGGGLIGAGPGGPAEADDGPGVRLPLGRTGMEGGGPGAGPGADGAGDCVVLGVAAGLASLEAGEAFEGDAREGVEPDGWPGMAASASEWYEPWIQSQIQANRAMWQGRTHSP